MSGSGSDAGVRLSLGGMCPTAEALQSAVHASHPPEETHGGEATQVSVQTLLQGLLPSGESQDSHPLSHRYLIG